MCIVHDCRSLVIPGLCYFPCVTHLSLPAVHRVCITWCYTENAPNAWHRRGTKRQETPGVLVHHLVLHGEIASNDNTMHVTTAGSNVDLRKPSQTPTLHPRKTHNNPTNALPGVLVGVGVPIPWVYPASCGPYILS